MTDGSLFEYPGAEGARYTLYADTVLRHPCRCGAGVTEWHNSVLRCSIFQHGDAVERLFVATGYEAGEMAAPPLIAWAERLHDCLTPIERLQRELATLPMTRPEAVAKARAVHGLPPLEGAVAPAPAPPAPPPPEVAHKTLEAAPRGHGKTTRLAALARLLRNRR